VVSALFESTMVPSVSLISTASVYVPPASIPRLYCMLKTAPFWLLGRNVIEVDQDPSQIIFLCRSNCYQKFIMIGNKDKVKGTNSQTR
jgi:hypothetical protein